MNGIHDMGGLTNFGPIRREQAEPVFHAPWERRVFGLIRTIIDGRYNWDEFRFALERLAPAVYLEAGYYERWLLALERYLVEQKVIAPEEMAELLASWQPVAGNALPDDRTAQATAVPVTGGGAPRFAAGDQVRARQVHPAGHTRLPRYARGKRGTIEKVLGEFIFPDTHALREDDHREMVYAVRFTARELWGEGASPRDSVCIDLWESYLQPEEDG